MRSVVPGWLFLVLVFLTRCAAQTPAPAQPAQAIQTDRNVTGQILCYAINSPDIIYVGTSDGIFRSTDAGKTWIALAQDLVDQAVHSINLSERTVFAATEGVGILRSTDDGNQWGPANTGVSTKYILSIAIDGTRVFAGTTNGGVFMSENAGANWLDVHEGLPKDANVYSLAVVGATIYAGTQRGVFTSPSSSLRWSKITDMHQPPVPAMWTDRIVP
ncbi:MAG TPA: hypothetical protein VMW43_04100 [Bacteroidota bacterium]|nr:hypothetical protein [Bacteroidota bacterium]